MFSSHQHSCAWTLPNAYDILRAYDILWQTTYSCSLEYYNYANIFHTEAPLQKDKT